MEQRLLTEEENKHIEKLVLSHYPGLPTDNIIFHAYCELTTEAFLLGEQGCNEYLSEEEVEKESWKHFPDKNPSHHSFRKTWKTRYWNNIYFDRKQPLQARIWAQINRLRDWKQEELEAIEKAPGTIAGSVHRASQFQLVWAIDERIRELQELVKEAD